jgi:hypothetical protein
VRTSLDRAVIGIMLAFKYCEVERITCNLLLALEFREKRNTLLLTQKMR